jgi:AcrR family transcriptional regulator
MTQAAGEISDFSDSALAGGQRETYRQRHRRQRHQAFLDVALRIVATEGLAALTMRRVTDELDCSEGSIYLYFPSKGALIAEVQRDALLTLGRSLQVSQSNLERRLAGRDPKTAAMARIVAASRFWVGAEAMFPREIELCRMLFSTPAEVIAEDEAGPVLSPALTLLEFGSGLLDAASDRGALAPGDAFERATVILAGSTGVLLAGNLGRWDPRVLAAGSFADRMLTHLFLGWGADPQVLDEVEAIVSEMARLGELVPPDPGPTS